MPLTSRCRLGITSDEVVSVVINESDFARKLEMPNPGHKVNFG